MAQDAGSCLGFASHQGQQRTMHWNGENWHRINTNESRLLSIQYRLRVLPSHERNGVQKCVSSCLAASYSLIPVVVAGSQGSEEKEEGPPLLDQDRNFCGLVFAMFSATFCHPVEPPAVLPKTSLCLTAFQPFDMRNKHRNGEACVENYDKPRTCQNRSCERQFWRERTWKQCKCKFSVLCGGRGFTKHSVASFVPLWQRFGIAQWRRARVQRHLISQAIECLPGINGLLHIEAAHSTVAVLFVEHAKWAKLKIENLSCVSVQNCLGSLGQAHRKQR